MCLAKLEGYERDLFLRRPADRALCLRTRTHLYDAASAAHPSTGSDSPALDLFLDVVGQPHREGDEGQHRVRMARGRKDGRTSDEQVRDPVDLTITIDHPLVGVVVHAGCSHMVKAAVDSPWDFP